jgi:hypothetical protein
MVRTTILPAILFLAVAIIGASVANAIVKHYALHALENISADGYAIGQEIETAVGEISQIFQEYGIEVPGKESRRSRPRADLTDEQRTAIRERVGEMRRTDATREEIRTAVMEMLKEYGVQIPDRGFRLPRGRNPRRARRTPGNDIADDQAQMACASPTPSSTTWGSVKASQQ